MKLHFSPTSPYVRKVRACAIHRGLDAQIERVPTNAHASGADLLRSNPLSKVPCLVLDDGSSLFDSPVICEYLDSQGDAPKLFPAAGPARWRALRQQALADGILDAAVPRRMESLLPKDEGREKFISRQKAAMERAVDAFEVMCAAGELDGPQTIGTLACAVALGYLDFRWSHEPWRPGHPKLAAWHAEMMKLPALSTTIPKDGG
ncbi:MAG: glutathione S-transferase N-terminal domain-containing protein [Alphaproteobacteria bacterium]|nr:glutathione S-transferase N-terminal domain-containing protein [Alphaproteobacteria bacterium]